MSPRVHFDGEPDRFRQMRALFNDKSTLRVKFATPELKKFRMPRIRKVLGRRWAA
jgi:hypothetical protein